jgi:diguanylate cyclase (GGDEF)-like protein
MHGSRLCWCFTSQRAKHMRILQQQRSSTCTETVDYIGGLGKLRVVLRTVMRRLLEAYVLVPVFAVLMLLLGWAALIHLMAVENAVARGAAAELSRELADTYEAQMARNLVAIDQTLKTVKYAYEMSGDAGLFYLHDQGLLPSPIVFQIAISGPDGHIRAAIGQQPFAFVANESFFKAQRDRLDDSPMPLVSQVTNADRAGAPGLIFSRRLRDAHGNFGGIVMLFVDPGYFTSSYDHSRMGDTGMLALLGTDGVVRAKRIGERISWGEMLATTVDREVDGALPNVAVAHSWDAGVRRYTNLRPLHGFPLVAIVGISEDDQLAGFRRHRRDDIAWASLGSVVVIILAFVLGRSSWQLAASRRQARQIQQTYYAASEASLDAFFVFRSELDPNGRIVDFVLQDTNRRGAELSGMNRDLLIGQALAAVFPQCRNNGMFDRFVSVGLTGSIEESEWLHDRAGLPTLWIHRQVVPVDGGVVAIMRDITSRKRADTRRAEQNRVLEMIATRTPLTDVLICMTQLLESQVAGSLCAALLRSGDGRYLEVGAAPNMPRNFVEYMDHALLGPEVGPSGMALHSHQAVIVLDIAGDARFHEQQKRAGLTDFKACWALPIMSHGGKALGTLTFLLRESRGPTSSETQSIAVATRIAGIAIERSQAEERIHHMALHDALTGLPNRSQLSDRLSHALTQARRAGCRVTVVFVDLDKFKLINDSLGHRAGDELLKVVANRMVACVRSTDTVVRLGGDEFVIVLTESNDDRCDATAMIERMRHAIVEPVDLGGQDYQVTCSMGVAVYPADGADAETLLMNADAAMYRAKEMGRNGYRLYTAEMSVMVRERLRLQEQLRQALPRNELRLVYQPQVDLRRERIFGVEALLRWDHPVDGPISPASFIPLAEETGLIVPIGEWVLHEACRQNKAWQERGLPPVTVAVNVSARQFLQKDLIGQVAQALAASGLDAKYLELELTESAIMQDLDSAIATMTELRAMGVRLSIDDFGTGYSSLSALKHFPIERLKIDQSFVRGLLAGENDRAIATAIIVLGRQLDLKVIAEGVETACQLQFLRDNGCNEIQGYYYSKPVTPEEMEGLMASPLEWPRVAA